LIGLLQPDKSVAVSDYALQVIQTLAASDPTTFREVADNLPPNYRAMLENAVRSQQEKAAAAAKVTAQRQRRPAKKMDMDFSQYDE
jgi:hypothetical protein